MTEQFNPDVLQDTDRPPFELGEITDVNHLVPSNLENGVYYGSLLPNRHVELEAENTPAAIWSVDVKDPYVQDYNALEQSEVVFGEKNADNLARVRRENGSWVRTPGTAYTDENGNAQTKQTREWGDPLSKQQFFSALGSDAINVWKSLIPSSKALMYLSDPNINQRIEYVADDGTSLSVEIDDTARQWLTLCSDARGIRSRATVMGELVKGFVHERQDGTEQVGEDKLQWMSVACGTALPTMQAAIAAGVSGETSLQLVDIDADAMRSTQVLAERIGFKGDISQRRINIFDKKFVTAIKQEQDLKGTRPELIDLMGIFEYIGDHLKGVDAGEFVSMYYDLLKPGGRMLIGQMRSDRPNPDFTMGVVGWPYVEMRTPNGLMNLLREAGIPMESTQLYLPKDGVYSVVSIDKPA